MKCEYGVFLTPALYVSYIFYIYFIHFAERCVAAATKTPPPRTSKSRTSTTVRENSWLLFLYYYFFSFFRCFLFSSSFFCVHSRAECVFYIFLLTIARSFLVVRFSLLPFFSLALLLSSVFAFLLLSLVLYIYFFFVVSTYVFGFFTVCLPCWMHPIRTIHAHHVLRCIRKTANNFFSSLVAFASACV